MKNDYLFIKPGKLVYWNDPALVDYDPEERESIRNTTFVVNQIYGDTIEDDTIILISSKHSEAEVYASELRPIDCEELNYYREFVCGRTSISRSLYESLPSPMNTYSLSEDEMQKLADCIEDYMYDWNDLLDSHDISKDKYDEQWWKVMEECALRFGVTYFEDDLKL